MSGHAVLVAALAGVVTPYLSGRWKIVPVGPGRRRDGRAGVRRGPQPARRHLWRGPRRSPSPAPSTCWCRSTAAPGHERTTGARPLAQTRPTIRPADGVSQRRGLAAAAVVALVALPACAGESSSSATTSVLTDDVITVGSFDFTESVAPRRGLQPGARGGRIPGQPGPSISAREFVGPALDGGLIELLPEYAGTAAEFHSLGEAEPTDDIDATHAELERSIAGRSLLALAPAPAENVNTFVVTGSDGGPSAHRHRSATSPVLPAS